MANVAEIDVLGEVLRLIEQTVKVPADQVDIDQNLESFGVNSLIGMELMEAIEKRFDVVVTPAQFTDVDTVRALAALLEKLLKEKAPAAPAAKAASVVPAALKAAPMQGLKPDSGAQRVLELVSRKYAIDLGERHFASVEEVVDALVSGHAGDLMRHYGLAAEGGRAGANARTAAPVRATLVAVVGMSCRLPDAPNPAAFWNNLLAQKNSIREIPKTRWDWTEHYAETVTPGKTVSKWGALIEDVDCFDTGFFSIPPEEAATLDPQLRLLLQESYHAVEDAGLDMKKLAGSRTGVFIGYEYSEYEHQLRKLNNKDFTKGPLFTSSSPSYYLANRISHTFGLCGPSESINVNCASSAIAINRAYLSLLNGESDVAIAGAASLNLFADDYITTSQYGVLSPNGTCGVFDDDANGFTRGEGVATVVLKRLEDAQRDNDRIYCVIRGLHENYRGAARNISEVKHEAITSVLTQCYQKARVGLDSVHYIEVDGYANKWADSFEYEGIKAAFDNNPAGHKHVALGSLKGNIGNVESVSGVANVIKLALALHHKRFPATISKKKLNGFIDIDSPKHPLYIADREIPFDEIRKQADQPIRAGVNSFADSGTYVHILLEEYLPPARPATAAPEGPQLFLLSAKDGRSLESQVQQCIEFLSATDKALPLAGLACTSQLGREALNERLGVVAATRQELLDKLAMVLRSGIKEKLGLESKQIFHGRLSPTTKSPLAKLITADMVQMQLAQCLQSSDWQPIAQLWAHGVEVPWQGVWQGGAGQREPLPTYPFAKERHWLDVQPQGAAPAYVTAAPAGVPSTQTAPETAAENAAPAWHFYIPRDPAAAAAHAAPLGGSEKMELFMQQEIARQMGCAIDEVALDRNFIDLGMNSIGVAELIIKLDRLLGANLSPSVLFKHPEVGSLSAYLAQAHESAVQALVVTRQEPRADEVQQPQASIAASPAVARPAAELLVPLQGKGQKTPIFALPGAGGNALSMQGLSHALGSTQPFYCIEPAGLDGSAPATSVEEAARAGIEALKSAQPEGPYRLLGYSNGGIVAFEMAHQLLAAGDKVASLALLDTLSPQVLLDDPLEEMMVAVFKHFVGSLGGTVDLSVQALKQVPAEERAEYLYERVAALGLVLPKPQFIATFRVATASEQACRAYRAPLLGRKLEVTLVRTAEGFKWAPRDYGWNACVESPVQVLEVPGDHFTLLDGDVVKDLAKKLQAAGSRRK